MGNTVSEYEAVHNMVANHQRKEQQDLLKNKLSREPEANEDASEGKSSTGCAPRAMGASNFLPDRTTCIINALKQRTSLSAAYACRNLGYQSGSSSIQRIRSNKYHCKIMREFLVNWSVNDLFALVEEYENLNTLKSFVQLSSRARQYASTCRNDLATLVDSNILTDVQLVYESCCKSGEKVQMGPPIQCHKAILAARSEYFRHLFLKFKTTNSFFISSQVDPNVTYEMFSHFIRYLYSNTHDPKILSTYYLNFLLSKFKCNRNFKEALNYLRFSDTYFSDSVLLFKNSNPSRQDIPVPLIYQCHKSVLCARSKFFSSYLKKKSANSDLANSVVTGNATTTTMSNSVSDSFSTVTDGARKDAKWASGATEEEFNGATQIVLDTEIVNPKYGRILMDALYLDTIDLRNVNHVSTNFSSSQDSSSSTASSAAVTMSNDDSTSTANNSLKSSSSNVINDAMELYVIAGLLDVPVLAQGCEDIILRRLTHETIVNVITWAAESHGSKYVYRQCIQFIVDEFATFSQSEAFMSLSQPILMEVLQSDFIQASELQILKATLRWAQHQVENKDLTELENGAVSLAATAGGGCSGGDAFTSGGYGGVSDDYSSSHNSTSYEPCSSNNATYHRSISSNDATTGSLIPPNQTSRIPSADHIDIIPSVAMSRDASVATSEQETPGANFNNANSAIENNGANSSHNHHPNHNNNDDSNGNSNHRRVVRKAASWRHRLSQRRKRQSSASATSNNSNSISSMDSEASRTDQLMSKLFAPTLFSLIRVPHIVPKSSNTYTSALKRKLISVPYISDAPANIHQSLENTCNGWIRSTNFGDYIRPRLFLPYFNEAKNVLAERLSSGLSYEQLRFLKDYRSRVHNPVPDNLYMVDPRERSHSLTRTRSCPSVRHPISTSHSTSKLSSLVPIPDQETLRKMIGREHELQNSTEVKHALSQTTTNKLAIQREIQKSVVREFGYPDEVIEVLQNPLDYYNMDNLQFLAEDALENAANMLGIVSIDSNPLSLFHLQSTASAVSMKSQLTPSSTTLRIRPVSEIDPSVDRLVSPSKTETLKLLTSALNTSTVNTVAASDENDAVNFSAALQQQTKYSSKTLPSNRSGARNRFLESAVGYVHNIPNVVPVNSNGMPCDLIPVVKPHIRPTQLNFADILQDINLTAIECSDNTTTPVVATQSSNFTRLNAASNSVNISHARHLGNESAFKFAVTMNSESAHQLNNVDDVTPTRTSSPAPAVPPRVPLKPPLLPSSAAAIIVPSHRHRSKNSANATEFRCFKHLTPNGNSTDGNNSIPNHSNSPLPIYPPPPIPPRNSMVISVMQPDVSGEQETATGGGDSNSAMMASPGSAALSRDLPPDLTLPSSVHHHHHHLQKSSSPWLSPSPHQLDLCQGTSNAD